MNEVKEKYTAIEDRLNDRLVAIEQGLAQSREAMNTLAEQERQRWRSALLVSMATVAIMAGILMVALLRQ
jgi:hypothetical protein